MQYQHSEEGDNLLPVPYRWDRGALPPQIFPPQNLRISSPPVHEKKYFYARARTFAMLGKCLRKQAYFSSAICFIYLSICKLISIRLTLSLYNSL